MSNELTTIAPTLEAFKAPADLVEVRMHPEKYQRIGATPFQESVEKMCPMVYAAFLYRGQETTEKVIKYIAGTLVKEILADTQFGLDSLSWLEIGMVIRRAVLGAGKEMFGVSVASLYAALVDYAKTEGHEACKQVRR